MNMGIRNSQPKKQAKFSDASFYNTRTD